MVSLLVSSGLPSTSMPSLPTEGRHSPASSHRPSRRPSAAVSAFRSSFSDGIEVAEKDVLRMFLKDRQENGDFISKFLDSILRMDDLTFIDSEDTDVIDDRQQSEFSHSTVEKENAHGFLKLTSTQDWIDGGTHAPMNRRLTSKEKQNNSEKRKKFNFLKYEALKRELLLITVGIGISCSGYCLVTLSLQASVSYLFGVLLSCLYLQMVYNYVDNLSKEEVPSIFLQKKTKKIGIRSEDLENLFKRAFKGSSIALSSPRLVFPGVIYGFWALSHQVLDGIFDFQLVPAMFGLFAYKAAVLVQVYRDNEHLRLVLPEEDGVPDDK